MEKCRRCPDRVHSNRIPEGWVRCEKRAKDGGRPLRLCDAIDVDLLDLFPSAPYSKLVEINEEIARRIHLASSVELKALPPSPESFVEWVQERHRYLFESTLPEIAGRIREDVVYFGASGSRHEREGSKPEKILQDLHWVYGQFSATAPRPVEYLKALELAHMRAARSSAARERAFPHERASNKPWESLERYIQTVLVSRSLDESEEEPPVLSNPE